ncbi:hypothetical protein BKA83DRAFT_4250723, partial [Pisolithus microcarpus]
MCHLVFSVLPISILLHTLPRFYTCTGRARMPIWYRHPLGHSFPCIASCSHFDRYWNARFSCTRMPCHWPPLFFSLSSSRHMWSHFLTCEMY